MKTQKLFPTLILEGSLPGFPALNRALMRDISELSQEDRMGQQWSRENYRGGYTSYASLSDLHRRTPVFMKFEELLQPAAKAFARQQEWSARGLSLEMTHCWMNIMPQHTYHTLHLHPHSIISGAYYVSSPPGSVSLKLEDPRMGLYMNAPVREKTPLYHHIIPKAGSFVLFESWLRHEVPPNQSKSPRISLSFNFSLAEKDHS